MAKLIERCWLVASPKPDHGNISFGEPSGFLVIGTGKLASFCVSEITSIGYKVSAIETEPGRFSPLEAHCKKALVPLLRMGDRKEVTRFLLELPPRTIIISAYNSYIFPREIVNDQRFLIVNFHNSLLPAHRGRNAPTWSIAEGDKETGVTWHAVEEDIDSGTLLTQRKIAISNLETGLSLTRRSLEVGQESFKDLIRVVLGLAERSTEITKATHPETRVRLGKETPHSGIITEGMTCAEVHRILRSTDFGPIEVFPKFKFQHSNEVYEIHSYSNLTESHSDSRVNIIKDAENHRIELYDGLNHLELKGVKIG
jgi:methionyl-tRNA formyltransferase